MAAEVFGSIVGANGVEDITLNNAATEATLQKLLASSMGANKQTLDSLKELAKSAGLDPAIAERAGRNINELGDGTEDLYSDFGTLQQSSKKVDINFRSMMASTGQLIEGTATLGGLLNTLGGVLPGKLGFLVEMLGKAADFQEKSLQAYQKLSDSGVKLAGDLIQIRISAGQMGLTLDQFTTLIKSNGPALASLGDTVDGSTQRFINFSTALVKSDAGRQLMNMGYSLEQINANSLDYLLISGGRRKGELEGAAATKQTTEAVVNYMSELDKLANLTGKSREKTAEEIKKLAIEPAWKSFLADPKNAAARDSLTLALTTASRFGESAARNFQASSMGLVVWSKESAAAAGMLPQTYKYLAQMKDVAQSSMSEGEKKLRIQELSSRAMYATVESARAMTRESLMKLSQESGARGETARQMLMALEQADQKKIDSVQTQIAEDAKAAAVSKGLTKQQVDDATAVAQAMKELGVEILSLMKGPLEVVSPVLKFFAENIGKISILLLGLGGILAAYKAYALGKAVLGDAAKGGRIDALFGQWGHSPAKALWVRVVPGGGSLGGADVPGGAGGPEGKGKGGKMKMAGKLLGGAVLAYEAYDAWSTISSAEQASKKGEISNAEANKQSGAAVGGLAGMWAGGALGAGFGSAFAGVGAIPGAIIGGLLGGIGVSSLGGLIGKSLSSDEKKKQIDQPNVEEPPALVTSYQKRTADNSDKMILILKEMKDIAQAQKDLAEWVPTSDGKGGLKWNKRRGPLNL
jgi:hypothetical protein